jgi:acyl dehydratase
MINAPSIDRVLLLQPTAEPPFAHELRPGDTYAPLRFHVSDALNQQFLFALADFNPDYVGSPQARAIVHPVLLLHMSARTRSPSFRLAPGTGSVFAKDVARFSRPALVDETLIVDWSIREVYEKRGRIYQALDTRVTTVEGDVVLQRDAHSLFFTKSGVALSPPAS